MFAWIVKLASAFRRLRLWKRVTLVALLAVIVPYLALWLSFWVGPGRWLWNYSISWHPALRHVVPPGPWDPLKGEPIWIEQIYESPHMSTWDIPELSSPTYHVDQPHSAHIPAYSSPSLLKLHIFSTIRNVSRPKRDVIRRLSPIYTIPVHLRHLVEVKFVIGKPKLSDGTIDVEKQKDFDEEQEEFGDLFQLDLKKGENLREGKILDWIRAVGDGEDGGRDSLWLFKMDDDTILDMPKFLDVLVSLDARIPHYLGTSLNRWPPYHHHFTGLLTGFSWGVVKTLATGIGKLSRQSIEWPRDDDVLTGEIMASLPSGPHCHTKPLEGTPLCDPRTPPEWGWTSPPWNDPRTGLIRYDFYRRLGNHEVWFLKCDVAMHGGIYKSPEGWEKGWKSRVAGLHWTPPASFSHYEGSSSDRGDEEKKRTEGERLSPDLGTRSRRST